MPMNAEAQDLKIVDAAADRAFRSLAGAIGRDPDNTWIGSYVEHVWTQARHLMQAYLGRRLEGCRTLEFGCNVGATAIVLARLGAVVAAVDIDERNIALAAANARRYGVAGVSFAVLPPPPAVGVPFENERFDLVTCSSVLEYVEPAHLVMPILRELDRVLRPGGVMLVMATSNRLAPREVHSGRWLANYLPRRADAVTGRPLQRGVSPWRIRRGLPFYRDLVFADRARAYFAARERAGFAPAKIAALRAAAALCRPLGWSAGMLTPSFFLALRKPGAIGAEPG
ncbi:MAG TPA: methyltransferase domain-containing protein [Stellaceae bacterium]|nr:methyltransferase domain-containing protein [Stellaceae bacterium]